MTGRQSRAQAIKQLRAAHRSGNLVLYLGAGVSVGSSLPTWQHLVAAMYFAALSQDSGRVIRQAYRNYLLAISEWYLTKDDEPIEITARKIRAFYSANEQLDDFMRSLHATLYAAMVDPGGYPARWQEIQTLLRNNRTLNAVRHLCRSSVAGRRSVRSVVTYNYDNLLEMSLRVNTLDSVVHDPPSDLRKREPYQSLWRSSPPWDRQRLPIYHVHGFIPLNRRHETSSPSEILFTEEEFNMAANNAYSWSNVVQIECMTNAVGLAIGLSMTDRNMRRLLDACRETPLPPRIYVLLDTPVPPALDDGELAAIRNRASRYLEKFTRSARMKAPTRELRQVKEIVHAVHREGVRKRDEVLRELGVEVVPLAGYHEIPDVIREIVGHPPPG